MIRLAKQEDIPQIIEIIAELITTDSPGFVNFPKYSEKDMKQLIKKGSFFVEEQHNIRGFVSVFPPNFLFENFWDNDKIVLQIRDKRHFYIELLGVKKEYQRHGIGSDLLKHVYALKKPLYGAVVLKPVKNIPSINLLQKDGWKQEKEITAMNMVFRIYSIKP